MQGLARQVEEAAALDKYDEANALQAELDSSTQEASALATEYSFTSNDIQDLAASPSQPPVPPPEPPLHQQPRLPKSVASSPAPLAKRQSSVTQRVGGKPQDATAEEVEPARRRHDGRGLNNAVRDKPRGDDPSLERRTQSSQELSTALTREGVADYEDGDSVDADVGYSSSIISASHAATDGSRSVQSARTVLDRMPEFNMDDAVSFRSGLRSVMADL